MTSPAVPQYWHNSDQPTRLPGPPRLPWLGSAHLIGNPKKFYGVMQQWLQRYGDPFFVKMGKDEYIVTSNVALSRLLFESRPDGVQRPPMIKRSFSSINLYENLFAAEGDNWRKQRKAIAKSLSAHHLGKAEEMIHDEVQRRLSALREGIGQQPNGALNFLPHCKQYSLGIITRLVFGDDFRQASTSDALSKDLSLIFNTLARRTVAPFQYWKLFKLAEDRAF